jgi:hypothetical protein
MKKSIIILFLLIESHLSAHEINTSYADIEIRPEAGRLSFTLTLNHADLALIFDLRLEDTKLEAAILDSMLQIMPGYFKQKYKLEINGELLDLQMVSSSTFAFTDELGNNLVRFSYEAGIPQHLRTLKIHTDYYDKLNPLHKNLVLIRLEPQVQQGVLSEDYPDDTFTLDNPNLSVFAKSLEFVWLGIEHIFNGYDHILFLLGVILLGGKFINLVKFVTAFTIAHSLTLILAALQIIVLPPRFVESLIALSIVYIAAENFFVKNTDQRWVITFIFGLIHGFGFAGVLTELGLPQKGLVAALLSFNIGVEIGQIVIVGLLYPLILVGLQPRWQKGFIYGVSSVILVFGLLWFVERAFNVPVGLL